MVTGLLWWAHRRGEVLWLSLWLRYNSLQWQRLQRGDRGLTMTFAPHPLSHNVLLYIPWRLKYLTHCFYHFAYFSQLFCMLHRALVSHVPPHTPKTTSPLFFLHACMLFYYRRCVLYYTIWLLLCNDSTLSQNNIIMIETSSNSMHVHYILLTGSRPTIWKPSSRTMAVASQRRRRLVLILTISPVWRSFSTQ